jgi:hypothetical protein
MARKQHGSTDQCPYLPSPEAIASEAARIKRDNLRRLVKSVGPKTPTPSDRVISTTHSRNAQGSKKILFGG